MTQRCSLQLEKMTRSAGLCFATGFNYSLSLSLSLSLALFSLSPLSHIGCTVGLGSWKGLHYWCWHSWRHSSSAVVHSSRTERDKGTPLAPPASWGAGNHCSQWIQYFQNYQCLAATGTLDKLNLYTVLVLCVCVCVCVCSCVRSKCMHLMFTKALKFTISENGVM